ncbi:MULTISPECIES: flagellar basal body P-ring formation chaperone FlgA [Methylosinus]|uniref:Flagella basal body P-ring formation protein FlgA n=1 Tax=Methylosinus trichosporium (strain ATCC 35070 / NCIMB 11131 / UNIQEM 75 / OB3b) TaxID=595536 RepID=A0A2D2D410_METT3|nr:MULTISPECIES: flagellar basal body P-ring formation chaperone FlgA [Methylosinus]ATQ69696.1 flagella basal body P-ring formation protein FlgA [Methylosinus trichosporium OB3b]OBS51218.1 flagella basal body P-ring formation protein FlgA [Methylosinus sp. 3S-1]
MRRALAFVIAAFVACPVVAGAQERMLPTPRVVIYPGEAIRDDMLAERAFNGGAAGVVVETRSALIGKVARRTLLPDRPIPVMAVDSPRIVAVNAQVKIVFEVTGLTIVAYGAALQAGGVGDFIRVRNQDSGLVVTGRVQPDGSIRVSEG